MLERAGAIGRLLGQSGDRPAPPAAPATPGPSDSRVADRERRIAERLLEDEALRGDLDDATWQPIQDWLLARVHHLAASTAPLEDTAAESALESGAGLLRNAAGTLVSALEAAGTTEAATRLESIHRDLRTPLIDPNVDARAVRGALRDAAYAIAQPSADAPTAAARLVKALSAGGKGGESG